MIGYAWDAKPDQISGPEWINTITFAIEARMDPGTPTARALLMLQDLLADRFKLQLRVEDRASKVYTLKVVSSGSKLKATVEPAASDNSGTFAIMAPAMTMAGLARRLSSRMDRPVLDQTNLPGAYEMKLTWQPDGPDGNSTDALFRALREQLGLELKADTAPIKAFLVVGASKSPTEN